MCRISIGEKRDGERVYGCGCPALIVESTSTVQVIKEGRVGGCTEEVKGED